MKILTTAEMGETDRQSVSAGVSMRELMERAGEAVARFCLERYPDAARVLVLCGKGNNGGDGFVAARVLASEGVGVRVLLLGRAEDLKDLAAAALHELREATAPEIVEEWHDGGPDAAEALRELLEDADLLIDAVTGTGFTGVLRGAPLALRDAIRDLPATPVVAVDLPTGWDADSHEEKLAGAFRADAVVTFTAPKPVHVFGHLTDAVFGPVVVAEIGSPAETIESACGLSWTGSAKTLVEQPRAINSNKGKFGHVLVVGGSYGTAGAPSMASLACLRAGAGLVTAAVPRSLVRRAGAIAPELMVRGLEEDAGGDAAAAPNLARLDELLSGIKVLALGPGLSTRGETSAFARGLVDRTTLPLVLDADGLNAFAGRAELLQGKLPGRERTLVLTPHPGEMARLLGLSVPEVEADRVGHARSFATGHGVTLVLKGWRTLVAHPDGRVAVNTSGNPALAKGGSGDILTGIVAALLAQFPEHVAEAVEAAVYLHGLAADFAAQALDERTVLATDVITHLSDAFRYRNRDRRADGPTWLCGLRLPQRAFDEA